MSGDTYRVPEGPSPCLLEDELVDILAQAEEQQNNGDTLSLLPGSPSPRKPAQAGPMSAGQKERLVRPAASYGANADAYETFCELDADNSGTLDLDELLELTARMGLKLSATQLRKDFNLLSTAGEDDPHTTSNEVPREVSFDRFAAWYNSTREHARRSQMCAVKEAFKKLDSDGSGTLNREEFGKLGAKLDSDRLLKLVPPFGLEADWALCSTVFDEDANEPRLDFKNFEAWWKERLGIAGANIPVLPEYMVQKIEDAAMFDSSGRRKQRQRELNIDLVSAM